MYPIVKDRSQLELLILPPRHLQPKLYLSPTHSFYLLSPTPSCLFSSPPLFGKTSLNQVSHLSI